MDTGYRHDLTPRVAIPPWQIYFVTTAVAPILLATATNLVSGDKVVPQQIGKRGEAAEPYVLDSTPDVLSIWAPMRGRGVQLRVAPHTRYDPQLRALTAEL